MDCSCWRSRENYPIVRRSYRRHYSHVVSLHSVEDSSEDAFDFQTSGNTILRGFHMWKDNRLFPSSTFTIELYQGNTTVAKRSHTYDASFSTKKTFEVYFPKGIFLQEGLNYTAAVRMKGRKYNTAVNNALKYNFCSGANVTFWKSSFGRSVSSSYVRQIPALIFLGLKCWTKHFCFEIFQSETLRASIIPFVLSSHGLNVVKIRFFSTTRMNNFENGVLGKTEGIYFMRLFSPWALRIKSWSLEWSLRTAHIQTSLQSNEFFNRCGTMVLK